MFEINGLLFPFCFAFHFKIGFNGKAYENHLLKVTFKSYNIGKFSHLNITSAFQNKDDTLHLYCLDKLSGSVNLVSNDATALL